MYKGDPMPTFEPDWTRILKHSAGSGQLMEYSRQLEVYLNANTTGAGEDLGATAEDEPNSFTSTSSTQGEGDD